MNAKFHVLMALVFASIVSQAGAQDLGTKKGKELFEQNCMGCHQESATGKPGFAPSLSNKEFLSIASTDFLTNTIKDGREGTGMPPWKQLGDEDISAIVAYLQSLSPTAGTRVAAVNSQPPAKGDVHAGKVMFAEVCSNCHGDAGVGYEAGGSGTGIGRPGFLSKASDGYIRTIIKEGRSNTKMRPFTSPSGLANLTDQEIDNIIAYLRTAPAK